MLADPRAVTQSKQFATQWLNLDGLQNLQPDKNRFPNWSGDLANDMRQETLAFFEEVIWQQERPMSDLFNAKFTFDVQVDGGSLTQKGVGNPYNEVWYRAKR